MLATVWCMHAAHKVWFLPTIHSDHYNLAPTVRGDRQAENRDVKAGRALIGEHFVCYICVVYDVCTITFINDIYPVLVEYTSCTL